MQFGIAHKALEKLPRESPTSSSKMRTYKIAYSLGGGEANEQKGNEEVQGTRIKHIFAKGRTKELEFYTYRVAGVDVQTESRMKRRFIFSEQLNIKKNSYFRCSFVTSEAKRRAKP